MAVFFGKHVQSFKIRSAKKKSQAEPWHGRQHAPQLPVTSPKCAFVPSRARDAEQPQSRFRTNQFGRALNCLKLFTTALQLKTTPQCHASEEGCMRYGEPEAGHGVVRNWLVQPVATPCDGGHVPLLGLNVAVTTRTERKPEWRISCGGWPRLVGEASCRAFAGATCDASLRR